MRVIDFFDRGVRNHPTRACLTDAQRSLTYAEVAALSHRIANGLATAGVGRGARVAVLTPNSALAFAAIIGIFRAAAVLLPVPVRNPVQEHIDFLQENACEYLFYDAATEEAAAAISVAVGSLKGCTPIGAAADGKPDLLTWIEAQSDGPFECVTADPNDADEVAWIKLTGGTTGRPKSVLIPNRAVEALFATFHLCMPLDNPHVNLVAAPMTHGAGNIALAAIAGGGSLVIQERVDSLAMLDAIERYRITTLFLPPTAIYTLLALPGVRDRQLSSLRYFLYAGSPMSPRKLEEAIAVFGPVMAQAWGQTEAPLICTYLAPSEHICEHPQEQALRVRSCGRQTMLCRVEVMDDHGKLLGPGVMGELVVRSNLVMQRYLNRPEENEAASRFGWHHTGDVGYRDEKGFFYIVDRKKDMIITGGFNVYPAEIEQVLWRHPAVQDCTVIGVPDDKWGEAVKAIVTLEAGAKADEQELKDYCRGQLGSVKTPKSIEFWPDLPKSGVGKVLKREIRERYWTNQERRI